MPGNFEINVYINMYIDLYKKFVQIDIYLNWIFHYSCVLEYWMGSVPTAAEYH